MKKIAYLILAHSDPIHINRLINALDYNCDFYIHIDLKSDISKFKEIIKKDNVKFIEKRQSISWAGFNMVLATKELMRSALEGYNDYSHLVLLSGNDYPIKEKEYIYKYFLQNEDKELIKGYYIKDSNCNHCYNKIKKYRFKDKNINDKLIDKIYRRFKTYIFCNISKKTYLKINGNIIYPCLGSQWWALTPKCVKYILDFTNEHSYIDKYFKTSFAPDELYFHTIVFNSKFRNKTICNGAEGYSSEWKWSNHHLLDASDISCKESKRETILTLFKEDLLKIYSKFIKVDENKEYKGSTKFFTIKDFEEVINSEKLFVRKVNTELSSDLLDKIDEIIM